ncbi:MAG: Fic family protein [Flavobacteriaceae bacterium]|nr:Fic family protein [Flavobacteriaceae bacterium]MCY4299572.1 Fic family protein [Flavobacteriaceae bacterium]
MNLKFENLVKKYQKVSRGLVHHERYNLYALSCHSTGIEGSELSREDVNFLLDNRLTPTGKKIEDILMVEDHHEALKAMLEMAHQKNLIELSVADLRRLSPKILLRTIAAEFAKHWNFDVLNGVFRKVSLQAGNRVFMEPEKVPIAMDAFLLNFNRDFKKQKTITEIYQFSFKSHFLLVDIHPFRDGNGRLSRLIMNYVQRCHGLPMSIVHTDHKYKYFQILEEVRETNRFDSLYEFMFQEATLFFEKELNLIREKGGHYLFEKQSESKNTQKNQSHENTWTW